MGVFNLVLVVLNGFVFGVNRIVDEDVNSVVNGIFWDDFGKEGGICVVKGVVSFGGIIFYVGMVVEKKIWGEEIEFDYK